MLALFALLVYIGNIPFGYWRSNVNLYSFQWFLSIHLPVAIIIIARLNTSLGFAWYTYVISIVAFMFGQFSGKFIYKILQSKNLAMLSSCLVMDIYRYFSKYQVN